MIDVITSKQMSLRFLSYLLMLSFGALSLASPYASTAQSAASQIKNYDQAVSNVKTFIGYGSGIKTACSVTENNELEAFYCGNKEEKVLVFFQKSITVYW